MSRAFVNEDSAGWGGSARRVPLPPRDDPGYDEAAARALIEAAVDGETGSAEQATGYYWGDDRLKAHVRKILDAARKEQDEGTIRAAERYLR
ncbi:MAG: hypothetical protein M3081_03705 [Gemmatimonadota bacterium]|nr:hypothetical protein [Gemmatimonadota bacterium]